MIRARRRAYVVPVAMLIIAAAAIALGIPRNQPGPLPPRPTAERPVLLLLTSLPLVFPEDFSLQGGGSPALKALQTRYRVVPISVTDPPELARGRLLLMAHPLAQPAEDLVALDAWVRRGGRVLLLADPLLEPPMFMDTGLLAHWGLRLDAPGERGAKSARLGGYPVETLSPGLLSGGCDISSDRLVAHCRIGNGQATVVADADLLDLGQLGPGAKHNLDGLLAELARLERR